MSFFKLLLIKSLHQFFFVRVSARNETLISKPTTAVDAQKCSLWIDNIWTKSHSPFILYQRKSLRIVDISSSSTLHHFVENGNIFFRNCHNRWLEVGSRGNVICFKSLGRTFQSSRNIRQYRSFLQPDVKWLFL